jgi:hypothetical protein
MRNNLLAIFEAFTSLPYKLLKSSESKFIPLLGLVIRLPMEMPVNSPTPKFTGYIETDKGFLGGKG